MVTVSIHLNQWSCGCAAGLWRTVMYIAWCGVIQVTNPLTRHPHSISSAHPRSRRSGSERLLPHSSLSTWLGRWWWACRSWPFTRCRTCPRPSSWGGSSSSSGPSTGPSYRLRYGPGSTDETKDHTPTLQSDMRAILEKICFLYVELITASLALLPRVIIRSL